MRRVTLQLDLPADASVLLAARRVVEALLDRGEAGDAVDDVILAVDEACSNVIRHAFPAGDGSYVLSAAVDSSCIDLTVEDHGVGVDVDMIDLTAPIDSEATSGRGLGIIRQLMTSVEIESVNGAGGTRLRMHKRFLS